jgi:hypothetical protein
MVPPRLTRLSTRNAECASICCANNSASTICSVKFFDPTTIVSSPRLPHPATASDTEMQARNAAAAKRLFCHEEKENRLRIAPALIASPDFAGGPPAQDRRRRQAMRRELRPPE